MMDNSTLENLPCLLAGGAKNVSNSFEAHRTKVKFANAQLP